MCVCMNKTYICVRMYVYSIAVFKSWVLTPSISIYFFFKLSMLFSLLLPFVSQSLLLKEPRYYCFLIICFLVDRFKYTKWLSLIFDIYPLFAYVASEKLSITVSDLVQKKVPTIVLSKHWNIMPDKAA